MSDVARILSSIESGEPQAAEELLPLVYTELRRLAQYRLSQFGPGQTLQATALVHEAWLRLVRKEDRRWNSSRHFFCAAATAMRHILIDRARCKKSAKHGGHLHRTEFRETVPAAEMSSDSLIALDEALSQLAEEDAEAVRFVELRYFVGLGHQGAAEVMGISRRQADKIWAYARAWLNEAIRKESGANASPKS